jgi:DNA-binding transcriptional MerR regulator
VSLPKDVLLSTTQVVDSTGVTYRVLDYWIRNGVLEPVVDANGSGSRRLFEPRQVPMIRALGRIQHALNLNEAGVSTVLLGECFDAMKRGQLYLDLSDNVVLSWDLEP